MPNFKNTPLAPLVVRPAAQRPGTAVGMAPTRPDPTVAQLSTSSMAPSPMGTDRTTDSFTYFTRASSATDAAVILYNGDRDWAKVTLLLETAGPVVVGTRAELAPVLGGSGRLLRTDIPVELTIAKGTRIYILATAVNRVAVTIEPWPWLEQISSYVARIK